MNIRRDLEPVAPYISRLLSIGEEFRACEKNWSHFKNEEDFRFVSRIPHQERYLVEALYADGRDMAIYMYDSLLAINYDFSRYPTLTAIVEAFKSSWVYGGYNQDVPITAKDTCNKYDVNLWSVDQMVTLFKSQERLLAAVRITLQMLKDSDLYKMENGIQTMKQVAGIHISSVSGSSININSADATASITTNYNEPAIFADLISAIKSNGFDSETEARLVDNVQALAVSHQKGGFTEAYRDFMQNVSAHITVFGPFIAGISALL